MTDYLSNKFKWLSFFATWAVVGIHSRTFRWSQNVDWTNGVQEQIVHAFDWAVPTFFVISGFLFVVSYKRHGYWNLLCRKFKSLYIPCVCAMLLSEILTFPINAFCHSLPSVNLIFYAPLFVYEKFSISFHLWYVRDLLIIFLFSPVFFLLTKKAWAAWMTTLLAIILCAVGDWPAVPLWHYQFQYYSTTISFVLFGMALARSEVFFTREKGWKYILVLFVISMVATAGLWWTGRFGLPFRLSFVVWVWTGYDVLVKFFRVGRFPSALSGTFVVYLMHLVVIRYISGIGRILFGGDVAWIKMLFFFFHLMSFWLCFALVKLLSKYQRLVYEYLSGGR